MTSYRDIVSDVSALASDHAVTIVAASKTVSADGVRALIAEGHRVFGENRVQEAQAKWPAIRADIPDLQLRLIGPLQTNKINAALSLFDAIDSLDRESLATALAKRRVPGAAFPELLVQVNVGEEDQKAGVAPAALDDFYRWVTVDLALPVRGLMAIPPADEDPAPFFALMRDAARRLGATVLSMGMSADYKTAIRFGATQIRLGSAIFGARH